MTCIFCDIVAGKIPAKLLFQDDDCIAFTDIDPKAPHHILIIPKQHIATINDLDSNNSHLVSKMFLIAKDIAQQLNIAEAGYRLVINCNSAGGQAVYHIHLHLLAGRQMQWPPG